MREKTIWKERVGPEKDLSTKGHSNSFIIGHAGNSPGTLMAGRDCNSATEKVGEEEKEKGEEREEEEEEENEEKKEKEKKDDEEEKEEENEERKKETEK